MDAAKQSKREVHSNTCLERKSQIIMLQGTQKEGNKLSPVSRRKEIKIIADIKETENRKIEKTEKIKGCFYEKLANYANEGMKDKTQQIMNQ